MTSERWNSETTIKFIQVFRSFECLWNQKSAVYKQKQARESAFQKVAEEMNINGFGVPEVKKKMRTLRSTYYQEKKKIQNSVRSGAGVDSIYVPNILWFNEMDNLLKDVDERRMTIDNVHNAADKDAANSISVGTNEQSPDVLNITSEYEAHTETSQPVAKRVSKQKGVFRAIGELKKLQESINKDLSVQTPPTDNQDLFDIFGKNVAIQLRSLSFETSMIAQSRIQNILTELSIENYRCSNVSAATGSPASPPFFADSTEALRLTEHSGDNILSQAIAMTLENDTTVE